MAVCGHCGESTDRSAEARDALDEAVMLYEQKGNVIAAGKARELLDELRRTPFT